jgi:hypothetical protein
MGEAKRREQAHSARYPTSYFRGDLDRPLTFWRAIWRVANEKALKGHPYFYVLPRRERSNFLLRQLHFVCQRMGAPPMHELMFYIKRNPNTGYNEFLLIQSIAAADSADALLADIAREFPGDDYPVRRLDPDDVDPRCTIRIPRLEAVP